jgi:hypothetical protein
MNASIARWASVASPLTCINCDIAFHCGPNAASPSSIAHTHRLVSSRSRRASAAFSAAT